MKCVAEDETLVRPVSRNEGDHCHAYQSRPVDGGGEGVNAVRVILTGLALVLSAGAFVERPAAQTLSQTLAGTYNQNSTLNQARSQLRSTNEGVAIARSGFRPTASVSAESGYNHANSVPGESHNGIESSFSFTVTQDVFDGFQTANATRQADAAVRAERENLRSTEQTALLDAVTAFADVIQNEEILRLNRSNLEFLDEQVRASQDRFEVGEGTRTDISQAEADRQTAQADVFTSQANLAAAKADYFRVTGIQAKNLKQDLKIRRLLPKSLRHALQVAANAHPDILSATHSVDAAAFNVKQLEGGLLPTVSIEGSASTRIHPHNLRFVDRTDSASVMGRVSIPIYQGGVVAAQVRQAKEDLGTARINVDVTRDQVRSNAVSAWNNLFAAHASIRAAEAGVRAAKLALEGVIEEHRVGQRTRLDILDQQSRLIQQQISLSQAKRNQLVFAYTVLSAVGRLNARDLALNVAVHNPVAHYKKVRDKWFGLRTPDGR